MRLIDADELKKVGLFNGKWDRQNGNRHFMYGVECVVDFVNNLPTIEAEPVKCGKWEVGCAGKIRICSNCKESFDDTCNFIERDWQYCPNCGADMRGDKDETD